MQGPTPAAAGDVAIGRRRLGEGAAARHRHDGAERRPQPLEAVEEVFCQLGGRDLLRAQPSPQLDDGGERQLVGHQSPRYTR